MKDLQNFVNQYGLGLSKENLADAAYDAMKVLGHDVCLLNDKYLIVDGVNYQFIKSRKNNCWIVKAW